jgi:hypothetical protein
LVEGWLAGTDSAEGAYVVTETIADITYVKGNSSASGEEAPEKKHDSGMHFDNFDLPRLTSHGKEGKK